MKYQVCFHYTKKKLYQSSFSSTNHTHTKKNGSLGPWKAGAILVKHSYARRKKKSMFDLILI